ncbi:MAG TPA: hypothetical protein PLM79_13135 [Syntrophobacteraceae bacterium]|nr:hypothetical protein [Syntrophobacteraceae bacterium]
MKLIYHFPPELLPPILNIISQLRAKSSWEIECCIQDDRTNWIEFICDNTMPQSQGLKRNGTTSCRRIKHNHVTWFRLNGVCICPSIPILVFWSPNPLRCLPRNPKLRPRRIPIDALNAEATAGFGPWERNRQALLLPTLQHRIVRQTRILGPDAGNQPEILVTPVLFRLQRAKHERVHGQELTAVFALLNAGEEISREGPRHAVDDGPDPFYAELAHKGVGVRVRRTQ